MTTQSSDSQNPSLPNLVTVESSASTGTATAKETCRVFISRKTSDAEILGRATANRKKLVTWASNRLSFFDAALIPPGKKWREEIRKEIKQADILLLVVTRPAQNDFDWLLYEAGLFDMRKGDKNLICIYPEKSKPPKQLSDIQGVEAKKANILGLLERLFTDNEFTNTATPLSPGVPEAFADDLAAIAREIAEDVSGVPGTSCTATYVNPYIQLLLPSGAAGLDGQTAIKSNKPTLRTLFSLSKKPRNREHWTWADVEEAIDLGQDDFGKLNKQWIRESEFAIAENLAGKSKDNQVQSRFIANDKRIWRPEIEIWRAYDDGKTTVDITFSRQDQDEWLQKAKPPIVLAANLNLAVRIRHDLIETYLRRLPHWRDGNVRHFVELQELIATVERDGFFIRWLTRDSWIEVFDEDDADKVANLEIDFGENIHQPLHEALNDMNVKETTAALKLWRANNADFLSIGIPQYTRLLRLDA